MIAQFNPSLGDLDSNFRKIMEFHSRAVTNKVDLLAFPEMSLTGYQVQDLILKPAFILEVNEIIRRLASACSSGVPTLIGAPVCENGKIYNAYFLIKDRFFLSDVKIIS